MKTRLYTIFSHRFCPESVRWLFVHGRMEEGKNILRSMAKRNKMRSPDLSVVDDIITKSIEDEKQKPAYNYITLFKYKYTRWRILVFAFIW